MELKELLTEVQRQEIIGIMQRQCSACANAEREMKKITYAPYGKGRLPHATTAVILSGFTKETKITGFSIREVSYGSGLSQPELVSQKLVLHIYNAENPLNSKYIAEQCCKYNECLDSFPIYGCIQFEVKEKALQKVKLVVLDKTGKKEYEFPLYERPKLLARSV